MKNTKEEPTPLDWTERPEVNVEPQWVKDEYDNVYPQTLFEINGALFTLTQAKKLRDELIVELSTLEPDSQEVNNDGE